LGFQFFPRLPAEEYWRQFKKQYADSDFERMILSAESFFGGRPHPWELSGAAEYWANQRKKLEIFKSMLDDSNVEIVVYLRRQDQWLESAIQHIIRFEGTMGQRVYESDRQIMDMLEPSMAYNSTISLWDEMIRPSKIHVVSYDRNNFPDGNISADFMGRIGIKDENFEYVSSSDLSNVGWSKEFIELKKLINETERSRPEEDTIIDVITALDEKMGTGKKYFLDENLKKELMEKVQSENASLFRKYNNTDNIFPEYKPKDQTNNNATQGEIQNAMQAFEKTYKSPYGQMVLLKHKLTRSLRQHSPALHTLLAPTWRKLKNIRKRLAEA
jgi:hypothetical protein